MTIKNTVDVAGIQPEMVLAYVIAKQTYDEHNYECVITSCRDGRHRHASLHFTGNAIDLRTRNLGEGYPQYFQGIISKDLGPQYDVVLESDHIHIEFQPKVKL